MNNNLYPWKDSFNSKEFKYFDIFPSDYPVDKTGLIVSLFNPVRGTDYYNRIGRSSIIKSISIRGKLQMKQLEVFPPPGSWEYRPLSLNRMIIFIDWQGKGTAPTPTQVLRNVDPASQLNADNRRRFSVIKDKQWTFDACLIDIGNEIVTETKQSYPINIYEKVDIPVYYTDKNAGNYTDMESGAIYMLLIGSNSNSAVMPWITLNASIRVLFEDGTV